MQYSNLRSVKPNSKNDLAPGNSNICAVIIAYNPGTSFIENVQTLLDQVPRIVIVDNGSEGESLQRVGKIASRNVEVIYNHSNLGIAAALNQGLTRAQKLGFSWAVTLDQDSKPGRDMVAKLIAAYFQAASPERICILAPQVINRKLKKRTYFLRPRFGPFYQRASCIGEILDPVTTVITSGSLLNLRIFECIGDFREDFFIDYVDTEYCLRALGNGYRIVVACRATLEHRLGNRSRVQFGRFALFPTFHPPERWYYFGRNRIPMIREYAIRFPHWFTYDLVACMYCLLRMLLVEDQRLKKLHAFLHGLLDGLIGRMGEMR